MAVRVHLTSRYVNSLKPPITGEKWVSDAELPGFGVRLWARPSGGGIRYAIRVRNQNGQVARETFPIWSDRRVQRKIRTQIQRGKRDQRLGLFLSEAREWARDRIRILKGGQSRDARRRDLRARGLSAARLLTLEQMADRAFRKMEKVGRNPDYTVQLQKLFWRLSQRTRMSRLESVSIVQLAREISDPALPTMQSRALQSFVGHLYARLYRWYGPIRRVKQDLDRRIAALRRKQEVPHPRILEISPSNYDCFLDLLSNEVEHWREALALKFYFETGAKMRRVLQARWDHMIGDTWYPYSEAEREFWFMGREHLGEAARRTLAMAREKLAAEGRTSEFIFPRKNDASDRPIATVQRCWVRIASQMGWQGLPLSHVVARHRPRNTPSYLSMYTYMWVPISRRNLDPMAVAQLRKSPGETVLP